MRPFTVDRLVWLLRSLPAGSLVRHDVDVSPQAALRMATLEAELDVRAVYYLCFDGSPFYSLGTANVLREALLNLGHRVGAHVDERDPDVKLSQLRGLVSFHRPSSAVMWQDFEWFSNAYGSRWRGRYASDSRGEFTYGDPEELVAGGVAWQVNLHPEWWFERDWYERRLPYSERVHEEFFHEPAPTLDRVAA